LLRKRIADPLRFPEPIANLTQVAWRSASGDHSPERPPNVRNGAHDVAQIGPINRTFMPELHQCQARFYRAAVEQRRRKILSQLSRARAGNAAIDRCNQAPRTVARYAVENL